MSANNAFHVAVLAGDGIGPEVMAPALEILRKVEARAGLNFRFTDAPAGAVNYRETGKSMPDSTVRLCEEADAILLGACGLPSVRTIRTFCWGSPPSRPFRHGAEGLYGPRHPAPGCKAEPQSAV